MKQIRSTADLAIFGAPAAFAEPLHVGRPNIGDRERFLDYVNEILDRRWFTNNGPLVCEFERRVAEYLGVRHCVAMCNGTVALEIAIRALGLKGEVIVPSCTFIATAHALQWQEIAPVFADIDPLTHNLDPLAVRRMITPRTTGIIGVHLWGRPAPVTELQSIADEHGLKLVYDAAHAFGSSHYGTPIGNFGDCSVFSFHATKFFNTFEGGAVVTSDEQLAEKLRLMRNFGFAGYDNVIHLGTNGKMPEVCAAMGLAGLNAIERLVAGNRETYSRYRHSLMPINGIRMVEYHHENTPNYQYIVLEISEGFPVGRDRLVEILHAENIVARKYFWPGCHNMLPYRAIDYRAGLELRNTSSLLDRVLVLPAGPDVTTGQVELIRDIFVVVSENGPAFS